MAQIDIGNGFKITEDFLVPNPYSRPQILLNKVTKIAIHYVGNPKSTAKNNRDYFNNLATTKATYVSSHFVVGLQGEIIQCIPTNEIAYCTSSANSYSVSIETCHPDATGKFNDITEKALIQLVSFLCKKFGLTEKDIIRHYDVTGKICPKYYVDNPAAYENFKKEVGKLLVPEVKQYYKINKDFNGGKWNIYQKGAFEFSEKGLAEAIEFYDKNKLALPYAVFSPTGAVVYPKADVNGEKIKALEEKIVGLENQVVKLDRDNKALENELAECIKMRDEALDKIDNAKIALE